LTGKGADAIIVLSCLEMKADKTKKIRARAALENLEKIIDFVLSCARDWGLGEEKISDIHLAVDEACTNIIEYAYPPGRQGDIEVVCRLGGKEFTILLRDWGRPFNPLRAPAPDLELDLNERPVGGLGIFLMKKFSDRIDYRREKGANRLEIVKSV